MINITAKKTIALGDTVKINIPQVWYVHQVWPKTVVLRSTRAMCADTRLIEVKHNEVYPVETLEKD